MGVPGDKVWALNFFENVRAAARHQHRFITDVEFNAGVASSYIHNSLERGSCPTVRVAKAFADELGYTIDELLMEPSRFLEEKLGGGFPV